MEKGGYNRKTFSGHLYFELLGYFSTQQPITYDYNLLNENVE